MNHTSKDTDSLVAKSAERPQPEQLQRLSPTEWMLMRICWRLGRTSVAAVMEESLKDSIHDYRTVQTLLNRLVKKGYLQADRKAKIHQFSPSVAQPAALRLEIRHFLDDFVGPEPEHRAIVREMLDASG